MPDTTPPTFLIIASYFKGERFMRQAHARGAKLYLLTVEKLLQDPWPRECFVDVFAQSNKAKLDETIRTVAYLSRNIKFDRIVPMDDFDVETAAALREHFRMPGMNDSTARHFRDKLAMRDRARQTGIPVPDFTGVFNYDEVRAFTKRTPAPWMNKPRSQAGAIGITKVASEEDLFRLIESQGDAQSFCLLEEYLPGDVYHVDSITARGKVLFSLAHKCGDPPFDVAHGGGIFSSVTMDRTSEEARELRALNEKVLTAFGLHSGASHAEFIRSRKNGKFYFLEVGARVGGAHIAELIEAASGINPWAAWADTEVDGDAYVLPPIRQDYAGLVMTLAREAHPDLSAYSDPEVVYRAPEDNHVGLVFRSHDRARVEAISDDYRTRLLRDFNAVLPAATEVGH
jgi:hypothetical protein